MAMLYRTTIHEIGTDAADLLDQGVLILFARGAPPELAEVSILHQAEHAAMAAPVAGDHVRIGDDPFRITAVGETAWHKISEIGHVVFSFNGAAVAERPGEICVESVPGDRLRALLQPGTTIEVTGSA